MPKLRSKFQTLLSLLFLILFLNSCDRGCVESYQFDTENRYVDSNPINDGIFGSSYNQTSGGQSAAWHNSGVATDGTQMVFALRGAWTAWDDANTEAELKDLPECKICAKKSGVDNCICAPGQNPVPETDSSGNSLSGVDCSDLSKQADPNKCSCTTQQGNISDFGVYFIATNYQKKDESLKIPDDQETCRYNRGLGLYIGLFGKDGNTMPIRVYQMYSTQEVCDINKNAAGKCVDDAGNDQTKYLYKSPNGLPFVKDDKSGNNGSDTNLNDNEYHKAGEVIKFIIDDRYYSDNYGGYDVNFMSGFLRQDESGLLEYIVGTVEDAILGKVSANGSKRNGGALEFMYNSIVRDSVFIAILQVCLVMYITLFGISVLSGTLQISKKEMVLRITQLGLIIFFTTETSWYFYNQIVVGFFKDGMDAIISIFMTASDKTVDTSTLIVTSQLDRANSLSYATRFSYADIVIKKLLSAATAKKTLSLVFGEWFGIPYVMAIYALIFAFIYVMMNAALAYIQILLGLIFVLCLGPIFMVTLLFGATKSIFKRWIAYMASQSLQIICLFLVTYLFIVLIDKDFTELLSYRACTVNINFGLFNINFLISEANRDLFTWLAMFIKIGALLFLLKMIMEKIPGFAGHMVSVGGQAADTSATFSSDTNNSAFGLAGDLLGKAVDAAEYVWDKKSNVISAGKNVADFIGRETGISGAIDKMRAAIPFRGPTRLWEDHKIDKLIEKQKGNSDKDIRKAVIAQTRKDGISDEAVRERFHQKLVIEPLKEAVVSAIEEIKKETKDQVPLGREAMTSAVKAKIEKWATTNSLDPSKFTDLLYKGDFKSLIREEGALSSSDAAKFFAGNNEAKDRYLQHLQDEQVARRLKIEKSSSRWHKGLPNSIARVARSVQGKTAYNPEDTRKNFLAKVGYEEAEKARRSTGIVGDAGSAIEKFINQSVLNRTINKNRFSKNAKLAQKEALKKYFKDGIGIKKDLDAVDKKHTERMNSANEQYKKDQNLLSKQSAEKNLADAKARSEYQKQEDIKKVDKKVEALKKTADELIKDENSKSQEELTKSKIDQKSLDDLKKENEELQEMIKGADLKEIIVKKEEAQTKAKADEEAKAKEQAEKEQAEKDKKAEADKDKKAGKEAEEKDKKEKEEKDKKEKEEKDKKEAEEKEAEEKEKENKEKAQKQAKTEALKDKLNNSKTQLADLQQNNPNNIHKIAELKIEIENLESEISKLNNV